MTKEEIYKLRQPAKNRHIEFKDKKNGKIILNGKTFEFMKDAEEYMMTIPRRDIGE